MKAYNNSKIVGMVVCSSIMVSLLLYSHNIQIFGQEDNISSLISEASLNLGLIETALSFCETVNSKEKYSEFVDSCIPYLKDFNSKYLELAKGNPEFFQEIRDFSDK